MMKKELWLIWEEPITRRRYKIGTLIKEFNKYKFSYVNPELDAAKTVDFKYFPGFEDLKNYMKVIFYFQIFQQGYQIILDLII